MSTTSVAGAELADAAPRELRLLVAREQLRREPVAPLDLAEERLAVLRVAHCARRDEQRPLGAERLGRAAIVGEHVAHARDREGEEAAARVDALAEPRDPRLAVQLVERAVLDVGDEQPRRVRPEVERGDPHLRGGRRRRARRCRVASSSAARRTASWASETRRRPTLSSSSASCRPPRRPSRRRASALRGERVEPAQTSSAARLVEAPPGSPHAQRKQHESRDSRHHDRRISAPQMAQSHMGTSVTDGATIAAATRGGAVR